MTDESVATTETKKRTRRTTAELLAAGETLKKVKRVMFFVVKDAQGNILPDATAEIVEVIAQRDGLGRFMELKKSRPEVQFAEVDI